jgi:outer membrane murein-binding lipoprotein Lpp
MLPRWRGQVSVERNSIPLWFEPPRSQFKRYQMELQMITIEIHGTVFCADTIEEATALAKAFDLPLKGERQSNHDVPISHPAIKRGSRARMTHQLNRGLTQAGESAAHVLGAIATNVTPLAGGAIYAVIGKAGTIAEALGAKLQQMSKAAKVQALRSLSKADLKALLDELEELKPADSFPSSHKVPSSK